MWNEQEHCDQMASPMDSVREWAWNVGGLQQYKDHQWLLNDRDVWVKNPKYTGPEQPHPEDDYSY